MLGISIPNNVLIALDGILENMINMETGQRGFALTGNEDSLDPYHNGKLSVDQYFSEVLELTSDNPQQQGRLAELNTIYHEWMKVAENSISLKRNVMQSQGSMDAIVADERAANGKSAFDRFRTKIAEISSAEKQLLEQRSKDTQALQSATELMIVVGTVIAAILSLLIAFIITRMITRPILGIKQVAEQVADGNLDVSIQVTSKDEIGVLAAAFKKMVERTNAVMLNIQSSSEQVASGSRQVSSSSMLLSQGATEQASSVEQLTASLEEISSQTKHNADNANQANVLVETAKKNAEQGNAQMKDMLHAMDGINKASENISKIIKVIDEIAFQTNILALNAAVEAARAGQHGKGFAVVAEEVRNLAARSANAAKETTEMIEGSIKQVGDGTRIANETATALQMIVEDVAKVVNLVNNIAIASSEQASGVNQINLGLMQVSQVIQANTATSEESAAASEELSSQANLLMEQVKQFKLGRNSMSSGTYRGIDELSPEVLRMLEAIGEKRSVKQAPPQEEAIVGKRILLSDDEFGKY
ncbi:MAG: methyl-accepting chemotaxis protein [Candidatus Cohnella colombiensis]|uniref:Methyl-accepting chemotaxis protein n=1 Tax=Candidatus Cohnella colombiensis TaxID=3121368 RepID=A0AA95JAR3_9BACL|nr:MAG: methyl-accepting chemotaxis protein [Cohnella sp.]